MLSFITQQILILDQISGFVLFFILIIKSYPPCTIQRPKLKNSPNFYLRYTSSTVDQSLLKNLKEMQHNFDRARLTRNIKYNFDNFRVQRYLTKDRGQQYSPSWKDFLIKSLSYQEAVKNKNWRTFASYIFINFNYNAFLYHVWHVRALGLRQSTNQQIRNLIDAGLYETGFRTVFNKVYSSGIDPYNTDFWLKSFIYYILDTQPKGVLIKWLKESIKLTYTARITDYRALSEIEWVHRKHWLTNLIFENSYRSVEDGFLTTDGEFFFNLNHTFYVFILFIQQAQPLLRQTKGPLDYITTLFLLYFNRYVFIDSINSVWTTNYFLFIHDPVFSASLIHDTKTFAGYLQTNFFRYLMMDFFSTTESTLRAPSNTIQNHGSVRMAVFDKELSASPKYLKKKTRNQINLDSLIGFENYPLNKRKGKPPIGLFFLPIKPISHKKLRKIKQTTYLLTQNSFNILHRYYTGTFRNVYFLLRTKLFINTATAFLDTDTFSVYYNNTAAYFENNKLPFYHSSPWLQCSRATLLKYIINFVVRSIPSIWFKNNAKFFQLLSRFLKRQKYAKYISARGVFASYLYNLTYSIIEPHLWLADVGKKFLYWAYRDRYQYGETAILKQWVITVVTDELVRRHLGTFLYFYEIAGLTKSKPVRIFRTNDRWMDKRNLGFGENYSDFYSRLCRFQFASFLYEDIMRYIVHDNKKMLSKFAKTKTLGVSHIYHPKRLYYRAKYLQLRDSSRPYPVTAWATTTLSFSDSQYTVVSDLLLPISDNGLNTFIDSFYTEQINAISSNREFTTPFFTIAFLFVFSKHSLTSHKNLQKISTSAFDQSPYHHTWF